ncbi:MAG: putative phage abortive infection protein [Ignavibacteriales bacterium]|nr:putative phage abortive infection protein [Ignavibacteriales bacterium]
MVEEKKTSEKESNILLYFLITMIVCIWFISWALVYKYGADWDTRNSFGGMFGAINALFSGLAMAGIIYTIYLQKKELSLQRKELQQTREEFVAQNKTLRYQRFENTFFQLMDLHNDIVEKLNYYNSKGRELHGRDTFTEYLITYNWRLGKAGHDIDYYNLPKSIDMKIKLLRLAYSKSLESIESKTSHYFRNMYHIVKFIHQSRMITTKDEKQFYIDVLRAQLSRNELNLLYFNLLSEGNGYPRFTYLAKVYNILENVNFYFLKDSLESFEITHDDLLNIFHSLSESIDNDQIKDLINV